MILVRLKARGPIYETKVREPSYWFSVEVGKDRGVWPFRLDELYPHLGIRGSLQPVEYDESHCGQACWPRYDGPGASLNERPEFSKTQTAWLPLCHRKLVPLTDP